MIIYWTAKLFIVCKISTKHKAKQEKSEKQLFKFTLLCIVLGYPQAFCFCFPERLENLSVLHSWERVPEVYMPVFIIPNKFCNSPH